MGSIVERRPAMADGIAQDLMRAADTHSWWEVFAAFTRGISLGSCRPACPSNFAKAAYVSQAPQAFCPTGKLPASVP